MNTMPWLLLAGTIASQLAAGELLAAEPRVETGTVRFEPLDRERTPVYHRLDAHSFNYEIRLKSSLPQSAFTVHHLTFPSPVESPHPENNTVHAEYFRPAGDGPFPAVIVLDILDGGEIVPRTQASVLAQNGVAGLHVKMAYYGPRRPANRKVRMLSLDLPATLAAVRQTVLDCRRAAAWLAARPEVDANKIGIAGTSLGSFIAALTAEAEPIISKVALLYGGGGFVDGYAEHPRAKPYVQSLELIGLSRDALKRALAPVDPLTHADRLKNRDLLMIAAKRDDVVPPQMAQALWEATGRPKIVWYDTTHAGAALFALPAMQHVVDHFKWK